MKKKSSPPFFSPKKIIAPLFSNIKKSWPPYLKTRPGFPINFDRSLSDRWNMHVFILYLCWRWWWCRWVRDLTSLTKCGSGVFNFLESLSLTLYCRCVGWNMCVCVCRLCVDTGFCKLLLLLLLLLLLFVSSFCFSLLGWCCCCCHCSLLLLSTNGAALFFWWVRSELTMKVIFIIMLPAKILTVVLESWNPTGSVVYFWSNFKKPFKSTSGLKFLVHFFFI